MSNHWKLKCLITDVRQKVQPLDYCLHFLLANKLPIKFFFVHKSGSELPHLR